LYPEGILYSYPLIPDIYPVSLTLTDTTALSSNYNFIVRVLPPPLFRGVIINDASTPTPTETIKFPIPNKKPNVFP